MLSAENGAMLSVRDQSGSLLLQESKQQSRRSPRTLWTNLLQVLFWWEVIFRGRSRFCFKPFGRQDGCWMNKFKNGYMGFTRIISDVKAFLEEDMVVGAMDGQGRKNLENKLFSFELVVGIFKIHFPERSMKHFPFPEKERDKICKWEAWEFRVLVDRKRNYGVKLKLGLFSCPKDLRARNSETEKALFGSHACFHRHKLRASSSDSNFEFV
ncbi:hypothetical protein DKX38_003336 [Salix brachista]|uniref:Uncharacterized protein n=1 Tax=Salix brachista TaxID=2182728 RepID=A0A5N5NRW9_9ROSI|nr:hypothetical protein DKX38_003336 [Salix brachista]